MTDKRDKIIQIPVLDHGYVRFIESWGSGDAGVAEAGIIEAARQSTQGSFRGWDVDQKLLSYLFNSKPQHATPFEFAGMTIEVQAPIFVFREWQRHRTQSYNEMSARYSPLPNLNYIPSLDRLLLKSSTTNKQAGTVADAEELTPEGAKRFQDDLHFMYAQQEELYQRWLKGGVPKELARAVLPVGRYSRMRASANLRNWLGFLLLRNDPGAQWEIRKFACAVEVVIKHQFPRVHELFDTRRVFEANKDAILKQRSDAEQIASIQNVIDNLVSNPPR
ncbi:MAG: FAD-dependent thymidylate synthase [Giesbergeria sp.]